VPRDLKVSDNKHSSVGGKCILHNLPTAEVCYMYLIYFGPGGILLTTDPKNVQLFEIPKRLYIYMYTISVIYILLLHALLLTIIDRYVVKHLMNQSSSVFNSEIPVLINLFFGCVNFIFIIYGYVFNLLNVLLFVIRNR